MSSPSSTLTAPPAHPTLGGKSLQSLERPRYKSWRKKYRKMRHTFDGVLDENKRLFKEEQKLEGIAKRLREELDGLLELCLDLNQTPALPPHLRFDISLPHHREALRAVPPNITPEAANKLLMDYTAAVRSGHIPPLDLHVIRQQIDDRLAAQEVEPLGMLESSIPHATTNGEAEEDAEQEPINYLTPDQETAYLARLDLQVGSDPYNLAPPTQREKGREALLAVEEKEKHWAELTPRELERQVELGNPMSQHNWLRTHTKVGNNEADDAESLAGDTPRAPASSSRKRAAGTKNLAKQVGDRAVERAREVGSPGLGGVGMEEEEDGEVGGSAGRKRVRDPDGTFRLKGSKGGSGKGGGGGGGGKRKRSGEDMGGAPISGKKPRVDEG
ncbi:hypothetical protein LTR37_020783 [Vermiconidia calcicola]|uniref:Uncharacterized protein n=1 Tax=Vermiconidia calcicola TaxID=1690605 RepID=A0ACC3MAG7_9PEZI|nr:hypothetical protein LTR37_020783 [Vermiconidia calcicola]